MSIGRPSRMTPKLAAIFDEQADHWARRMSLKDISELTGFAPSYCWEQIQKRISENKSVSRETGSDETAAP